MPFGVEIVGDEVECLKYLSMRLRKECIAIQRNCHIELDEFDDFLGILDISPESCVHVGELERG